MMSSIDETVRISKYRGAKIALLAQHGKERVLDPVFHDALGARIELVTDWDTDQLGTFTREIPRHGNQLEAARKKAELAMELSGLDLGVASEGSFGPGPLGIGVFNRELVVFLDARRNLEVVGHAMAPSLHERAVVRTHDELHAAARAAMFPEHALVLRPNDEQDPRSRKGIRSWRDLDREFSSVQRESASGVVFVESDLRAHVHPTRMRNIGAAAADLVRRVRCPLRHVVPRPGQSVADPCFCNGCNP